MFVGLKNNIDAVRMNRESVSNGFIKSALPPFMIGVGCPTESVGGEDGSAHAEDADLLAWEGGEGLRAEGGCEEAMVGVHDGLYVELTQIVGKE